MNGKINGRGRAARTPRTEPEAFTRQTLQTLGLPATSLKPADGWSNRVWLTPTHVLRVSSGRFQDAYAHERHVLTLLPPDVPHARLLASGQIDAREWMVLERVPGVPLLSAWRSLQREQRRAAVLQLGFALRALHTVLVPADFQNPWLDTALAPGGHPENAYHAPPHQYQLLLAAVQGVPTADRGLLAEVGAFIAERLDAFTGDHRVLVHGDLHFANVMWHMDTVSALLDFEGARLAAADQELDTLLRFVREPAMYEGADDVTRLTPDDLRKLPGWLAEAYPHLLAHPRLTARLEVYEALRRARPMGAPPRSA